MLYDHGKCSQAEAFYRDMLAKLRQFCHANHPIILAGTHNLALAITDQGRFAEAEAIYRVSGIA